MRKYNSKALWLEATALKTKMLVIISVLSAFSGFIMMISKGLPLYISGYIFIASVIALIILMITKAYESVETSIKHKVFLRLIYPGYGNPLCLRDGECLPHVKVTKAEDYSYIIQIDTISVTTEILEKTASAISSALNGKLKNYAVTVINSDVAHNCVSFKVEDVLVDRSYTFSDVNEMKPPFPTIIKIQKGTNIDLQTSGSMLVAGKTRSGKTTGIIAMLIQALSWGHDGYGSNITIIDPKRAELSMLPHVISVDDDGEARSILQALKDFEVTIKMRQTYLNNKSLEVGDAIHWWEMNMHPSFLFIDEYVACRTLFPKRAEKQSDYCLQTYDDILRRAVTMGASAGCFVIISIAEASVESAGLPTMLKNAMTTKILFRPTLTEGRLMWNSSKLESFPERVYSAGECWFSSTDGEHDDVTFAHFPHMTFKVYKELGGLLKNYYGDSADGGSPQDGARPE